jgi:hypothetical protein
MRRYRNMKKKRNIKNTGEKCDEKEFEKENKT